MGDFGEVDEAGEKLEFVHFEYMHIRMKPQSTRYARASPTANNLPKYVVVAIYSNNILKIYDTSTHAQDYNSNPHTLMTLNLTEEAICIDPREIVSLNTAKTPAQSYKRDNHDLRPDDLPTFNLLLDDGRYYFYTLHVIDRKASLSHYRRTYKADTRYQSYEQSKNFIINGTEHVPNYNEPEIRVGKVQSTNLVEMIRRNATVRREQGEVGELVFLQSS